MAQPTRADARDRRRLVGGRGERVAAAHLEREGYEVLDRNFRTRAGELDLIATGRGCLVFCEVRCRVARRGSRRALAGSLESIGPQKRRQLRLMAREWLARSPGGAQPRAPELRFDAIGVVLAPDGAVIALDHLENAF